MNRGCGAGDTTKLRERFSLLNSPRGFTLLEILVAIAILSIAVTVILQLFSADLRAISVSGDYVSAATKAQMKMRELLDEENLDTQSFTEVTDDGYRIDTSVSETLQERTENLQVRMFEIAVTIHWTRGIKDRSLTLRTLKAVQKEI